MRTAPDAALASATGRHSQGALLSREEYLVPPDSAYLGTRVPIDCRTGAGRLSTTESLARPLAATKTTTAEFAEERNGREKERLVGYTRKKSLYS